MNTLRLPLMLLSICLTGCATTTVNNLSALSYVVEPSVQTYADPAADFSGYKTFSVIPPSILIGEDALLSNPIEEKQILFSLRNAIEQIGYRFVELDEEPDLIFTIDGNSPYEQTYVPPQTVVLPRWIPGTSSTTYSTHSGSVSASAYGSGGYAHGYGTYSGNSTSTTTTSGRLVMDTVTRPGYSVGYYYPTLTVVAFAGDSGEIVWSGNGVATSLTADLRISCQSLIYRLANKIPISSPDYGDVNSASAGKVGVYTAVVTVDGNNYFPAITGFVGSHSPGKRAGFKVYDIITAIDGQSMLNVTIRKVWEKLVGPPASTARIDVWRLGKFYQFSVTRRQVAVAN